MCVVGDAPSTSAITQPLYADWWPPQLKRGCEANPFTNGLRPELGLSRAGGKHVLEGKAECDETGTEAHHASTRQLTCPHLAGRIADFENNNEHKERRWEEMDQTLWVRPELPECSLQPRPTCWLSWKFLHCPARGGSLEDRRKLPALAGLPCSNSGPCGIAKVAVIRPEHLCATGLPHGGRLTSRPCCCSDERRFPAALTRPPPLLRNILRCFGSAFRLYPHSADL